VRGFYRDGNACAAAVRSDYQIETTAPLSVPHDQMDIIEHLQDPPSRQPVRSHLVFILIVDQEGLDTRT